MKAKILLPTHENLFHVAQAIRQDEVVGIPTETVYGLAGNCRSPLALARIFETKERPTFDPLIIHVGPLAKGTYALERLELIDGARLSVQQRRWADQLILHFWPGPLTLVLPKHPSIPDLATSGLSTVALRMPRHSITQALISASQCSLAAPSANRFGKISPTTAHAVESELGDRIHWILDGGACEVGLESTIISLSESDEIKLLRPGGTSVQQIEDVLGITGLQLTSQTPFDQSKECAMPSPGMLESHYAPEKPFLLLPKSVTDLHESDLLSLFKPTIVRSLESSVGLLLMSGDSASLSSKFEKLTGRKVIARTLSREGNLQEAAHQLFTEMRYLDSLNVSAIYAEPCFSLQGLGFAITDRLKRASARYS